MKKIIFGFLLLFSVIQYGFAQKDSRTKFKILTSATMPDFQKAALYIKEKGYHLPEKNAYILDVDSIQMRLVFISDKSDSGWDQIGVANEDYQFVMYRNGGLNPKFSDEVKEISLEEELKIMRIGIRITCITDKERGFPMPPVLQKK